jgi:hypothetical protein
MPVGRLATEADLKRWLVEQFPSLARKPAFPRRIIAGIINTTGSGSISAGEGFSITRNGTGDITITFDADFNRLPAVTATKFGVGVCHFSGLPGLDAIRIVVKDAAFAAIDGSFSFVAVES